MTVKHLKKKADILSADNIKKTLTEMYDKNIQKQLQSKTAVSLLYYGLLRGCEVLMVNFDNVYLDKTENVEIDFPHPTKRSARGFS